MAQIDVIHQRAGIELASASTMQTSMLTFIEHPILNLSSGIQLLYLCGLLAVGVVASQHSMRQRAMSWQSLLVTAVKVVGLMLLAGVLGAFPIVEIIGMQMAVPNAPMTFNPTRAALFALVLPILVGGMWGVVPAIFVGAAAGFGRALILSGSWSTIFSYALIAGLMALFIRQTYAGQVSNGLRRPLVAAGLSAVPLILIHFFESMFTYREATLSAVDYAWRVTPYLMLASGAELLVAGLIGTAAQWFAPKRWVHNEILHPPPWEKSLRNRLTASVFGVMLIGLLLFVPIMYSITIMNAPTTLMRSMVRDADMVAANLPLLLDTGTKILDLAAEDVAATFTQAEQVPSAAVAEILTNHQYALSYYDSLWYYDRSSQLISGDVAETEILRNDQLVALLQASLSEGISQTTLVLPPDLPVATLFIVHPVLSPSGQVLGVLLGSSPLATNLYFAPIMAALSSPTANSGFGLLLSAEGEVVHTTQAVYDSTTLNFQAHEQIGTPTENSAVYLQQLPNGQQQLALLQPVSTLGWQVVMVVPYEVVLTETTPFFVPIVVVLAMVLFFPVLLLISLSQHTSRLMKLTEAGKRLAGAQFEEPIGLGGSDEAAQLSRALDQMRERLKARMEELGHLLKLAQSANESLEPSRTLPPIAQAAQQIMQADSVRLMAFDQPDGSPIEQYVSGPLASHVAALDDEILLAVRNHVYNRSRTGPPFIQIDNVQRSRMIVNLNRSAVPLKALLAFPLHHNQRLLGVLWLGFSVPQQFKDNELNFLVTLAGQAAALVNNARLYEASERGRQQLQAILNATPDPVLVTDARDRLRMINPPAANVLAINSEQALGKPISSVVKVPALLAMLPSATRETRDCEVRLGDDRVYRASAAPVSAATGETIGQVIVLRDVTNYKDLDQLKSEILTTVSHDMRRPLSELSGYAKMIPMFGPLTPKQQEYSDRIVREIAGLDEMVENLLSLQRLEKGAALNLQPLSVRPVVDDVLRQVTAQATQKNIRINNNLPMDLPLALIDGPFVKRALVNLLDNAIMFSENGGQVLLSGAVTDTEVVIAVHDDGPGIAASDIAHIFEAHVPTSPRGKNAKRGGVGLEIVRSVAERHGGRAWAESKLGQGSTFYLALPRTKV